MTKEQYLSINTQAQASVLGWILKDKEFAYNCKVYLLPEMFNDSFLQEIYEKIIYFLEEYKVCPSLENLSNLFFNNKEYSTFKQKIYECEAQTRNFPLSYLSKEINTWIRLCIYKKSLHKAIDAYKSNQDELLKSIFNKTINDIVDIKFNGHIEYQFGDIYGDIETSIKSKENALTTGLKELDSIMGGGLFRGEHTLLIAPSGTGKTTVCINFLYHNIFHNKHCLFLTHEMTSHAIAEKIRQRMLYKTYAEFIEMVRDKSEETKFLLEKVENKLKKYLTYIPYNKAGGMYVEDVVDIIRQKNIELFNKEGKYYDLIVDDYPGKLISSNMKQYKEIRHSIRYVYEQFHQLALEFNSHAISPVQTNRDAYKKNKNRSSKEGELLGAEDISEAFSIITDASNAITVNRSEEAQDKELLTFYVDKTRSSVSRKSLLVKTDYTRAITHDQRLQDSFSQELEKKKYSNLADLLKKEN